MLNNGTKQRSVAEQENKQRHTAGRIPGSSPALQSLVPRYREESRRQWASVAIERARRIIPASFHRE